MVETLSHDSGGSGDSTQVKDDMGEPAEFPDDSAADLRDAAEWLDTMSPPRPGVTWVAVVDSAVKGAQDLLGNHFVARDLAIKWGTDTTAADVSNSLVSAKGELDSYWEGGAKDGFSTYFDSAVDAIDTAKAKFEELSATLVDSIRYIYRMYGEAIDFIMDAAAEAVAWNPYATQTAISNMVNRLGDLISVSTATTGDFAADATTLTTLPSQFTAPAELASSVEDPTNWEVREKSGG